MSGFGHYPCLYYGCVFKSCQEVTRGLNIVNRRADIHPMNRLVVLLAVATACVVPATHATASSSSIDGSGGALQNATRLGNATAIEKPVEPQTALSPELQRVLDLTNAERTSRGLGALTYNAQLGAAAQAHSQDQANMGTLTHTGSDGSNPGDRITRAGYSWRTWAENAAAGYRSADDVMVGWMNSAGHRANLLNPKVTEIGLGLAFTVNGYPYWTQNFAAPR
jgi:uncharacterized protein YkwD